MSEFSVLISEYNTALGSRDEAVWNQIVEKAATLMQDERYGLEIQFLLQGFHYYGLMALGREEEAAISFDRMESLRRWVSLIGSWVSQSGRSRMRFFRSGTWHEFTYSASCGSRKGLRVGIHGRFTLKGSILTLTAVAKSELRWHPDISKGMVSLTEYPTMYGPINSVGNSSLEFGEFVVQRSDGEQSRTPAKSYKRFLSDDEKRD